MAAARSRISGRLMPVAAAGLALVQDVSATLAGALLLSGIVGAGRRLTAHDAHKMESATP